MGTLARLAGVIGDPEARLTYSLRSLARTDGKPAIELSIAGVASVACQRCLSPMSVDIHSRRVLVFSRESAFGAVEDESEEEDYLPIDEPIAPLDVVEEEFLLALPWAPRHEEGQCPGVEDGAGTRQSERSV